MPYLKNHITSNFLAYINSKLNTNLLPNSLENIRGFVDSIIGKVASDTFKIEQIAKKSYKHINGFTKIVLYESEDKSVKIRLHIWSKDFFQDSKEETDLHDHRWSYLSLPIMGALCEKKFEEDKYIDENNIKYMYQCFPKGDSEWLNLAGYKKVSLVQKSEKIRKTGEVYSCKAGEIHQLDPCELPAATIVVTYNPIKEYARAYRNQIESEDFMHIHVPNFSPKQVHEDLSYVMASVL